MLIPLPGGAFGRWGWMAEEYDTETMTGNMANPVPPVPAFFAGTMGTFANAYM